MTWVAPFKALPRPAADLLCGVESGPEAVYADDREAEEAADRRHDFSDHLEPWEMDAQRRRASHLEEPLWSRSNVEAAWSWHMGPDR